MINKINNNCSFKANLETSLKVANPTRYKRIQELFQQATAQYPKETLYLSQGKNGKMSLDTTQYSNNIFNKKLYTQNLEEYMNKYNDIDITKKLVSAFKVLRLTDLSTSLKKTIQYNKEKLQNNTEIAQNLHKVGKKSNAKKYELFAKYNDNKIKSLNAQLELIKKDFYKQRDMSSKQIPEIAGIEI